MWFLPCCSPPAPWSPVYFSLLRDKGHLPHVGRILGPPWGLQSGASPWSFTVRPSAPTWASKCLRQRPGLLPALFGPTCNTEQRHGPSKLCHLWFYQPAVQNGPGKAGEVHKFASQCPCGLPRELGYMPGGEPAGKIPACVTPPGTSPQGPEAVGLGVVGASHTWLSQLGPPHSFLASVSPPAGWGYSGHFRGSYA